MLHYLIFVGLGRGLVPKERRGAGETCDFSCFIPYNEYDIRVTSDGYMNRSQTKWHGLSKELIWDGKIFKTTSRYPISCDT
jgi:hypothetical protein